MRYDRIQPDNEYRKLLFKRGFFATCKGELPLIHEHWKSFQSDKIKIAYDPELNFSVVDNSQAFMAVLGPIVSLKCDETEPNSILNYLFDIYIQSEDAFFSALNFCGGRFVIVFGRGDTFYILNDACGMRMVFYATTPFPAAASHSYIVKEYFGKDESAECRQFLKEAGPSQYNMSFLPGLATKYEDVFILSPNTRLKMTTGIIERYYPRNDLDPIPTDRAVKRASGCFASLMEKYHRLSPLAVSLTAGMDTRLTASATKTVADSIQYFTYVREGEKVNIVDAAVARRIAAQHNLNYLRIPFKYELSPADPCYEDYKRFRSIAALCAEFEHFFPLAYAYLDTFPNRRLHVRSNIGEICRARYDTPPFAEIVGRNGSWLAKLVRIYNRWTKAREHVFSYRMFEKYLDETNILHSHCHFDLPALFYWEHLMATWHGSLLLESDLSHDTVSIFNCRAILATFLAAPFEDRISGKLMLDVMRRLWDSLLEFPINPSIQQIAALEED
jgi:hypothetical protein